MASEVGFECTPTYVDQNKIFSYNNVIPPTTKSLESITPSQTANLPKPVTSSTTINPLKHALIELLWFHWVQ